MNQNQRREYLRTRDLEMSKQMEKTIKDAQPKPKPDMSVKLLKPIQINTDLLRGTPQYTAERQLADLSLAQQLKNTIKQAMYSIEGKTPEKTANSVTDEMIEEYKREVMKPVEINGQQFLYQPVEVPPIPDPFYRPYLSEYLTEKEFTRIGQSIFNEHMKARDELDKLVERKVDLEDKYASGSTMPNFLSKIVKYGARNRKDELDALDLDTELIPMLVDLGGNAGRSKRAGIIKKIVDLETRPSADNPIEKQIILVDDSIAHYTQVYTDTGAALNQLEADYVLQQEIEESNRLVRDDHESYKRQFAEELMNDFNRLNRGKTQITRQAEESNDDFLKRLQDMGNVFIDPADRDKQIQTEILLKAKKNILELTNELSKAETVVKMLNNEERFKMNKTFPFIKKKYSETFGINNKNMDANEIKQFIQNELVTGQSLTEDKSKAPTAPKSQDDLNALKSQMRQFSKIEFEQIIDEFNDENPQRNLKKGSIKEMVLQLNASNLYDAKKFRIMLKTPDANVSTFPIEFPKLQSEEQVQFNRVNEAAEKFRREQEAAAEFKGEEEEDEEDEVIDGGGIKNHVLPSTVAFGKIALDLNKLFYQNVLSIKRHNGNKIIGHKNKRVSDNFVEIILKLFENKQITQTDLKNIKDELMLYDNLIVQSGLHKSKKIPTNIEQTSEQMKNRLGLITGEIEAGNSNKSLLSELHELLFRMVRVHLISKNAATAYYKNIKETFFTL